MQVAIVYLENTYATQLIVSTDNGVSFQPLSATEVWDTAAYLSDESGKRLLEEIARRVQTLVSANGKIDGVGVVMPGTIHGNDIVGRSTRLNIKRPVNVAKELGDMLQLRCAVFNDAHAFAIGEASSSDLIGHEGVKSGRENFAYIHVDEGIGMSLFVNGTLVRGAGSAGHLGRLVMEPSGEYNPAFTSRGPLEVYAARPWISRHIVGAYLAENDRGTATSPPTIFSRQLAVLSANEDRWAAIEVRQLSEAVKTNDPLVRRVLDDAARYLGSAVNAVIAIANPPLIILGGSLMVQVPTYAETTIRHARWLSWGAAWKKTTFHISKGQGELRLHGAARLLHHAIRI